MARKAAAAAIYEAAEAFRRRCLVERRSFLWPASHAWTSSNIVAAYDAIVGHPDDGKRKLIEKLKDQTAKLHPDEHRIVADVFVFYELFPNYISAQTKVNTILRVSDLRLHGDPPGEGALQIR